MHSMKARRHYPGADRNLLLLRCAVLSPTRHGDFRKIIQEQVLTVAGTCVPPAFLHDSSPTAQPLYQSSAMARGRRHLDAPDPEASDLSHHMLIAERFTVHSSRAAAGRKFSSCLWQELFAHRPRPGCWGTLDRYRLT